MGHLRLAVLAPPWIPVPAPGYGGIEEVVRLLCDGLVARGHDVTLFAAPESRSPADVQPLLEDSHPDEIERSVWEVDHVARAFDAIDEAAEAGQPYDLVHDHCGFAGLAMADRLDTPLVHTMHGPFDESTSSFYAAHGHKGTVVAISHSQLEGAPEVVAGAPVVHNPLALAEWPFADRDEGHLLWIGRMAPIKGPHRAVHAARAAGLPLVLAGPVQPGQEEYFAREVEPHIDGDAVRYVGEATGDAKKALFAGARALLMPIRWAEPFGLVMVEAMACGTPVVAFREGAAREVVLDGETGFLVDDEDEMAAAVERLGKINRAACRRSVEERFDVPIVVAGYEAAYAGAVERSARRHPRRFTRRPPTTLPPRAPRAVG